MRIAYVTDQILPRRATDTFQLVSMAAAFGSSGAEVTIVTPARRNSPDADAETIAQYYRVAPTFSVQPIRSMYPLFRGFEKVAHAVAMVATNTVQRADVLYTRNLPVVTAGLIGTDIPLIYETYRPWPEWNRPSRYYFDWVAGRDNFLGAILHSNHARDSYLRTRIPEEKLLTAYNGFNRDIMEPRLSKSDARRLTGIPMDVPVVTYVGSVSVEKGVDDILQIAQLSPEVQFVIVGSEGQGPIERAADRLANVSVLPWRPLSETVPFLLAADVLMVPPSSKPLREVGNTVLPIKVFLYLAAGRAIFAPATPDVSEILRDGMNAVLVEPDDPPAAALRLRALLDDPEESARLGLAAARQSVEFTWDRRADKILAFVSARLKDFERAHGRKGGPAQRSDRPERAAADETRRANT